jgi:hypothetical protein
VAREGDRGKYRVMFRWGYTGRDRQRDRSRNRGRDGGRVEGKGVKKEREKVGKIFFQFKYICLFAEELYVHLKYPYR